MNTSSTIPIFGDKLADQTYLERPGAYAVIRDAKLRIATLRVGTAFFLPGGGIESDETSQIAIQREIMEECGRAIQIGRELGKAIEYLYARNEGVYYQIQSTFFEAIFIDGQVTHINDNPILIWLSVSEAIHHLQRESQAWAVRQSISSTDGFPGTSREG
jgi:8-oxo-dGTP diphosphatase